MLSWIDKLIPQPPETPKKAPPDGADVVPAAPSGYDENVTCTKKEATDAPKVDVGTQDGGTATDKSSGGVLGWLTQGLGKVVPKPVDNPFLARGNQEVTESVVEQILDTPKSSLKVVAVSDSVDDMSESSPVEHSDSSSHRVLSWLSHGLEKVIPQPTWSLRASPGAGPEPSAATEEQKPQPEKVEEVIVAPVTQAVSPVPPPPPVIAEVQSVVTSEVEAALVDKTPESSAGSGVLNWLKLGFGKVVPQPEMAAVAPKNVKVEKPSEEQAPSEVTRKDSNRSSDSIRVLSWISQGLEKVIPQPVITAKQDSHNLTLCQVEGRGSGV